MIMKSSNLRPQTFSKNTVRTPDIVQAELKEFHDTSLLSWREISNLSQYKGIPAGTLCAIYNGAEVPKKWLKRLGLSSKPHPPAWVTEAAQHLARLEAAAGPSRGRTYNRLGKRVT
jgi:hypothetical protein